MDDALTGDNVQLDIQAVVADALTLATVVDLLVAALKSYNGYEQHLVACVATVAEHIAAEYSANV